MATPNWDDDDRIGLPRGAGRAGAVAELPLPAVREPMLREGENDLGRPAQVPAFSAPLSEDDRRLLRDADEVQARRDLAEAEELLASDPAVMRWAGWFAHPLAAAFLVGSVGVLGLFLYSQVLCILANIATQPTMIQYAGYTGLGLLSSAVLYAMLRLGLLYARLRRNRQLRLDSLEELQARTRLRWLVNAKVDEARQTLTNYLVTFPIETDKQRHKLLKVGFTPEIVKQLNHVSTELRDPAKFSSSPIWFDRFRTDFQSHLDDIADARVKHWANRAMIVTATSPNSMVDSLSTLYFSFAMLSDLCTIYNLKTGRTGTAVLLSRVFFNAYLAGQLNDMEGLIEGQSEHLFEHAFQMAGVGVSSGIAGKFLGKVGAKATTGYLNRVLLNRLGRYACRLLRPVTKG